MKIALLFSVALVPALLAACGPDWNALDPSLGGAATTHATTTASTTTSTQTTGSGGSGQTTTSTQACITPFTCPGTDSTCETRTCTGGACGVDYADAGTHCGGGSAGRHCDGMGNCN